MIDLKANITTVEDYKSIAGNDLEDELSSKISNIDDNSTTHFIQQIEDFIKIKYMTSYGWDGTLTTDHQTNCFKKAVVYQIMYELQSGSLWNDSGYSMTSGLIIDPEILNRISIAPMTHQFMRIGGMANIRRV